MNSSTVTTPEHRGSDGQCVFIYTRVVVHLQQKSCGRVQRLTGGRRLVAMTILISSLDEHKITNLKHKQSESVWTLTVKSVISDCK